MASILDKNSLFYATCLPFFAFFALYDAFIFPHAASIEPSLSYVMSYIGPAGGGANIVASIISHWTSALFYVVAEVYASVSIGVLFWQFANDVVSVSQAKRFYPLFAQMSGLAPIFAGQYVVRYASRAKDFSSSMHRLNFMIVVSGIAICTLYRVTSNYVAALEKTAEELALNEDPTKPIPKKKKKHKMSLIESAKFLAGSKYLRLISILVIGYGLSINFTEILWKSLVKKQYPDALDYQRFMGNFSSLLGFSTCIVIFLGVQVIQILGWKAGALATPVAMALLAIPFFACVLLGLDNHPTNLHIAVMLGAIQSLLSKTGKYAMFGKSNIACRQ
jgi:AAA family ATP:ADP antiporter